MSILIADDDKSIISALKILLDSEAIESEACLSPADVLERISEKSFQLALIDLNYYQDTTSGEEGLQLITDIRKKDDSIPIVVMTGWGTIAIAVEAMRRGASDFIEKPWKDNNRLLSIIRSQIKISEISRRERKLSAENRLLREAVLPGREQIVAQSPAMLSVLKAAEKVAASDIPVLITGENGTGKSLLAVYIHAHSSRCDASMITVNMGGISESAFESEMFGHVKGAFTDARSDRIGRVELADDGSLFLDEIANTPLSQQAKLLRLLEERQYEKLGNSKSMTSNTRFISATNSDLDVLVTEKGFRQDLLYRLNGVTLRIPPLRERREDIPALAEQFLAAAQRHSRSVANGFADDTLAVMAGYSWPGNVRELSHVVECAVLLAQRKEITPADLQLRDSRTSATPPASNDEDFSRLRRMTLEEVETFLIGKSLQDNNGDVQEAAQQLGLSRSAMYRRLQKYGIPH